MAEAFTYDAFIAYASVDAQYARQLYAVLTAVGHSVFLDSEALIGGDSWPRKIRQAQQRSRLTIILISDRVSDSAYFQQEEILSAIDIARNDQRRRVVPLYLTGRRAGGVIPHPLKQLHGIYWEEGSSLISVAQKIEAALKASKQQEWLQEIVLDTVIIVTGCDLMPELFDRPSAYELKASIDYMGGSVSRTFLRSAVMGDIWFFDHSHITGHPNLISVGGPGTNHLTVVITGQGKLVREGSGGRWQIMRDGNRWALFGNRAEDTYDAVSSFKDRDLPGFLEEIWSKL